MQAELITELSRMHEIEDDWRAFAELRGNAFVSPEWFSSAVAHLDESRFPSIVAVRRSDGSLAGVMPLVLDTSGRRTVIRFGGAAYGDRFGPAAAEADENAVAAASMAALEAAGLAQNVLLLENVDVDRSWWRDMGELTSIKLARFERRQDELPYIPLRDLDWESYLGQRSANFRQQVRRRERTLRREHHVALRPATEASLEGDLARLFELHAARWETREGRSSLEGPVAQRFLSDFAVAAQRQGWLRLRLLEVDGSAVGAFLGWRVGSSYAFYQSGFEPAWSHKSVGTVLLALTIKEAIDEGAAEFDMLLGTETYKRRFTPVSRSVKTIISTPAMSPTRFIVSAEVNARRYGHQMADRPVLGRLVRAFGSLLPRSRWS